MAISRIFVEFGDCFVQHHNIRHNSAPSLLIEKCQHLVVVWVNLGRSRLGATISATLCCLEYVNTNLALLLGICQQHSAVLTLAVLRKVSLVHSLVQLCAAWNTSSCPRSAPASGCVCSSANVEMFTRGLTISCILARAATLLAFLGNMLLRRR